MQTGTKSKEKNGKFGKVKFPKKDTNSTINPDLSNLRKPIDTSISTLYHISKLLEDSTEEIKSILTYECDVIYECRICRSLFRSIVNLISHKREYCREKFNITLHKNIWDDLNTISAIAHPAINTCQAEEAIIKTNFTNDRILRSQVSKETCKKDLTTVIDTLIKKQNDMRSNSSDDSKVESVTTDTSDNQDIYLRAIETNSSAVYQTIKSPDTVDVDNNLTVGEIMELQNAIEQDSTMLREYRNENQSEKNDSPTLSNLSDKEDKLLPDRALTNNLDCAICNAKFSTKKTLTFHMKKLHTPQRMCYTCPCCANVFANTWSVHRHLFKIHKKNHEQVRKLRLKIQEIPFNWEATAMQDLKKNRATKLCTTGKMEHNYDLGNSNEEGPDMEDFSCNRCGQKFDTKTALSTHSQHCQAFITTYNQVRTKIKQSNSSTSSDLVLNISSNLKDIDASKANFEHTSSSSEIIGKCLETATHLEHISTPDKEDWDMLKRSSNYLSKHNLLDNNNVHARIAPSTIHQNPDDSESPITELNENSQPSKIEHEVTKKSNSMNLRVVHKKSDTLGRNNKKRKINLKRKKVIRLHQDNSTSHLIWPNKPEHNLSMENKMAAITNLRKLQCLLCKRKFTTMTSLRRHMAIHIGWYRYRCKLCDFKCFFKCDCVVHCNKMHNAQNNHAFMAEMVIEIAQDEGKHNENVVICTTDVEKKADDLDDAKTTSSPQSEIREGFSCSSHIDTHVVEKNEEVSTNVPTEDVSSERDVANGTMICTNLEEYMENRNLGKLNVHSKLKQMVMEVIFGSSDADSTAKEADVQKELSDINNEIERDLHPNDKGNNTASTDDIELAYCPITDTDNSKPQRPMRNRIRPLSKDFIYDLKDIQLRKESLKSSSSFQLGKSSGKHHLCDSDTLTNARRKVKLCNRMLNSN